MEKDSNIYRGKKERVKSIGLKAKKESSDDETLTSGSDDEEYAMGVRNFKKFFRRNGKIVRKPREEKKSIRKRDEKKGKIDRKCFRCGDPNHLIGYFPKPTRNKDQKAFIGGSWSDIKNDVEDKTNDKTCLMAQSSNEVCLRTCLEPDEGINDSGCSKHMTGNKSLFSTYKAYNEGDVVFGSNLKGKIIGKGTKMPSKYQQDYKKTRAHAQKIYNDPNMSDELREIYRTLESRYVHEERTIDPSFYNDLSDDSVAKFTAIGNRDHTQAVIALMLYCLENGQPFNLAYFIIRMMYFFKDRKDKVLPYGMILTRLFKNHKENMAEHPFDERYKHVPRKMSPFKGKQHKSHLLKELGM
nr:alpha/beta hydrolases superfamily protein [Tanacetum cinerariifolium]